MKRNEGTEKSYGYIAGGVCLLVLGGAAYCAVKAWNGCRANHTGAPLVESPTDTRLLDAFLPAYEVADRRQIVVDAPADVAHASAKSLDLNRSFFVRAIFRARELVLRSKPEQATPHRPVLDWLPEIGWGILAERPGREIVLGAVTKPWEADVHFRAVPTEAFAGFAEPGYVKIVWNLAVRDAGANRSLVSTETRAAATDASARKRFRRYWRIFSPGIRLIRILALRLLKQNAESRLREIQRVNHAGQSGRQNTSPGSISRISLTGVNPNARTPF